MGKIKKIITIFIVTIIILVQNISFSMAVSIFKQTNSYSINKKYNYYKKGEVYYAIDLKTGRTTSNAIYNTKYLQGLIDLAQINSIIHIPKGTYYFASSGANVRRVEEYVIKCRSNITIEGEGTKTILKPYGKTKLSVGGIDMFYFNNYMDYNDATYLENVHFRNFVIDGNEAKGAIYNSSGKGFMINLYKNCSWDNILVKNTDGTGFGMDCPINSTIKNCVAMNCGKAAKSTSPGASGFGIGTGYSNNESIQISNCISLGNKKFGIFFEHQGRFDSIINGKYKATEGKAFIVSDCVASGNMYDFGGVRANDVIYKDCISNYSYTNVNVTNVSAIHFEDMSRRIKIENCKVSQKFIDVPNKSVYYYEPVYWALNKGITDGTSKITFSPQQECTKAQAIMLLWRMAERKGEVVYSSGQALNKQFENVYDDVPSDASYVDAVKWAKEEGIIDAESKNFYPNEVCTRKMFINLLWKYAGKPKVEFKHKFTDVKQWAEYEKSVNWAVSQGILKGTTATTFSPDKFCTRAEVITFLYRYSNI